MASLYDFGLFALMLLYLIGDSTTIAQQPPMPPQQQQQQQFQQQPNVQHNQVNTGSNQQQYQQQQQQQQQYQQPPQQQQQQQFQAGNPMLDKAHVQDKEHLREHLEGVSNKKPEEMTEQEMQFHYFKLHDTDSNNKLDGLELVHAITHYHSDLPGEEGQRVLADTELGQTIDAILKDDDADGDGYIDYQEFVTRSGP